MERMGEKKFLEYYNQLFKKMNELITAYNNMDIRKSLGFLDDVMYLLEEMHPSDLSDMMHRTNPTLKKAMAKFPDLKRFTRVKKDSFEALAAEASKSPQRVHKELMDSLERMCAKTERAACRKENK